MSDPYMAITHASRAAIGAAVLFAALLALAFAAACLAVATWAVSPADDEPRRIADTGGVYVWVSA